MTEEEDPLTTALRSLCKREGGYQVVADLAHISAANLWQVLNGTKLPSGEPRGIGPAVRRKITAAYPDWLNESNVRQVLQPPASSGRVPLISWVVAGELCESPDNYPPNVADEWFECPVPHGPRTYCLQLDGDSMDDGSADAYRDGEIIFVDPDASPDPGRDVVVRTPENKTTFKRYKQDAEGPYLLGLNGKKIYKWVRSATLQNRLPTFGGALKEAENRPMMMAWKPELPASNLLLSTCRTTLRT